MFYFSLLLKNIIVYNEFRTKQLLCAKFKELLIFKYGAIAEGNTEENDKICQASITAAQF